VDLLSKSEYYPYGMKIKPNGFKDPTSNNENNQ